MQTSNKTACSKNITTTYKKLHNIFLQLYDPRNLALKSKTMSAIQSQPCQLLDIIEITFNNNILCNYIDRFIDELKESELVYVHVSQGKCSSETGTTSLHI